MEETMDFLIHRFFHMKKPNVDPKLIDNEHQARNPEMFNALVSLLENHPFSYASMLKAHRTDELKNLSSWIESSLPQLSNKFYSISTKCNWILNGLVDFPKCQYPGCSHRFDKINLKFNVHYSNFCVEHSKCNSITLRRRKESCKKKFGVEFPMQASEIKEKARQTNLKNLGVGSPLQSQKCRDLGSETRLKEHGSRNWCNHEQASLMLKRRNQEDPEFLKKTVEKRKSTNIKNGHPESWTNREKAKKTRLENHGSYWTSEMKTKSEKTIENKKLENPNYDLELRQRIEKTTIERHGVKHVFQTVELKDKLNAWIVEHGGKTNVFETDFVKCKSRKSMIEHHGAEFSLQALDVKAKYDFKKIKEKGDITKRENGTFNSSKLEDLAFEKLCGVFGEIDVERQFKCERYPFNCDFYIRSIDTFIELNGTWTHGKHPFDANSKEDQMLLGSWKEKARKSKFYAIACDVWSHKDVEKRRISKTNNLNFKEFWNIEDLEIWLESIKYRHGEAKI